MTALRQSFSEIESPGIVDRLANTDPDRARSALYSRRKGLKELALLLCPGADLIIEELAEEAHRITRERFGRTMQLYAPLYLSNRCVGGCPYCGFSRDRRIARRALTLDEIAGEAALLREAGMQSILLVSGDDPHHIDVPFLVRAIETVIQIAPSVTLEVAPLPTQSYAQLAGAGADGITLYQETYDRTTYARLHDRGPKADFDFRLEALARAGAADFRKLTAGVLWGLAPWRAEALRLGWHAACLQTRFWQSHVSIGMPRLRQVPEDFEIPAPLNDRDFVHLIVALRVFMPDAGIVLSTRESPELRNRLMPLGITQMSAGSSTQPGGYRADAPSGEQFEVADRRTPAEVAAMLESAGYEPMWKNWDRVFAAGG